MKGKQVFKVEYWIKESFICREYIVAPSQVHNGWSQKSESIVSFLFSFCFFLFSLRKQKSKIFLTSSKIEEFLVIKPKHNEILKCHLEKKIKNKTNKTKITGVLKLLKHFLELHWITGFILDENSLSSHNFYEWF